MKKLYFLIFVFLFSLSTPAQVLINEVCAAGDSAFLDEDASVQDWIEFYNAGSTTVNLAGYKIKDVQGNNVHSWTFPQIYILPQQHLTVFFSGKNRKDFFDHWEIPAYPQVNWRYFPGIFQPASNWADPAFNDASWLQGAGPIGYGDGDDATLISPVVSLYQRYSFSVADTSKIILAAVLTDFDDGFVAYLNGKEIARENIGAQGTVPAYNEFAFEEHEAQQYQNGNWSGLYFVPSSSLDTILRQGLNTFAVETHNYSGGMDDLSMLPALLIGVVDTSVTYPPFPATIFLHTDYELNAAGSDLTLYNPQGGVVDHELIGPMQQNHSRGRQPDGAASWCLFTNSTPDTVNYSSSCYAGYGPSPLISLASGFYSGTQSTSITSPAAGSIYWTNDGSDPAVSSTLYSGAVTLNNSQSLRAKLIPADPNYLPGPASAATYFINENVSLPVVSLTTDPANLFDPDYGMYVLGNNVPDTTITGIPYYTANFWQGWTRPANVAYFDKNKQLQFEEPVSIKIQGNWSKIFPQKGFSIDFDENYGGQNISYRLFPDKPATSYASFNVRNAGSDWGETHLRDRLIQKAVQPSTSLDVMDGFACVLFLNGQYWGVYELREKQDKHYLANNSTCDDDNTDFLEFDGSVIEGDNSAFFRMVNTFPRTTWLRLLRMIQ